MQTAHELFLHELSDMLDAERKLVDALGEQAESASNSQLQKAFQSHQAQTEKQVQRLEQVFEQLEEQPEGTECKGMKGLIEEVETFKQEDPSEDILDVFSVGAAAKVEAYEINAYESLIQLAKDMGHNKAVRLLQQNLKEEQQTLKKMQGFSKKIKPEQSGMEEEEETERGSRRRSSRRAA
ncbi:MAG TPA: ferritin-like domain-containing protein [Candidatus Angelobacter sp.]|nr:ferritin-like domain-containing protein [Candidatus Angelobacter sp.]